MFRIKLVLLLALLDANNVGASKMSKKDKKDKKGKIGKKGKNASPPTNPPAPTNPPPTLAPPTLAPPTLAPTLPPMCPMQEIKYVLENYACSTTSTCEPADDPKCVGEWCECGTYQNPIVSVTPLETEGEFCHVDLGCSGYILKFDGCKYNGPDIEVDVTTTYGCDENCENCVDTAGPFTMTLPSGGDGCHVIDYGNVQPPDSLEVTTGASEYWDDIIYDNSCIVSMLGR